MKLAILSIMGLLVVNVVAFNHARAFMRFAGASAKTKNPEQLGIVDKLYVLFTGINNPRPSTVGSPADVDLSFRQLEIPVRDGVVLGAWYIPHAAAHGGVIMFHGFTSSKSTLLPEAAAFHARGYSVLMIDFRGSGESSESYTTVGYDEALDVDAAIRYAQSELGIAKPILYGRSMGACAVLRAIAIGTGEVAAVILEGVFDRMLSTVKQRFIAMHVPPRPLAELLVLWGGAQHGFWAFGHNPVDYASHCNVPVLMLHGSDDPRATLAQAETVFAALPGEKRLVVFEGAGHEALMTFDRSKWNAAVEHVLR